MHSRGRCGRRGGWGIWGIIASIGYEAIHSYMSSEKKEITGAKPEQKTSSDTIRIYSVEGDLCNGCAACISLCKAGAISLDAKKAVIIMEKCVSCDACYEACPVGAIVFRMKRMTP